MNRLILLAGATMFALGAGGAQAGNIVLTGHDVLLHSGQNGFDAVAMDFLRGAGTTSEIAKADYNFAVVGTASTGFARFTSSLQNIPSVGHGSALTLAGTSLDGYSGAVFLDAETMTAADLAGLDGLVILSHTSCGGCSLTTAGSNALNALSGDIASAFNDDMDIWGLSGASLSTYYEFLPAGVVATGASISGSSGFDCTAAGAAIGLTGGPSCSSLSPSMINGHATHNRFPSFAAAFEVFEVRGDERITIGIRDATITDDDIIGDPTPVPEPGTLALLGLGLGALSLRRRRDEA